MTRAEETRESGLKPTKIAEQLPLAVTGRPESDQSPVGRGPVEDALPSVGLVLRTPAPCHSVGPTPPFGE